MPKIDTNLVLEAVIRNYKSIFYERRDIERGGICELPVLGDRCWMKISPWRQPLKYLITIRVM